MRHVYAGLVALGLVILGLGIRDSWIASQRPPLTKADICRRVGDPRCHVVYAGSGSMTYYQVTYKVPGGFCNAAVLIDGTRVGDRMYVQGARCWGEKNAR